MTDQKNEKLSGVYRRGKIIYTIPHFNCLTGGSWKTGWNRVYRSGGEDVEFEIINEEMIDKSKVNKYYIFEVIDGKAKIIN